MSNFFKNTRKLTLSLSAIFLVITLTAGSFAVMTQGLPQKDDTLRPESAAVSDERVFDVEPLAITPSDAVRFNMPDEMNGVILAPGTDFIKAENASGETIRAEVDKAVDGAKNSGVNSVMIGTSLNGRVIYHTGDTQPVSSELDIMDYILQSCREQSLYTYAIFDVSLYDGEQSMDRLNENIAEFAGRYAVDGVVIDGYAKNTDKSSYAEYLSLGGSIGYGNYLNEAPAAVVRTAAKAVRKADAGMQVGLLAGGKGFTVNGLMDFVAVNAGSGEAVSSWADIAEAGMPLYAVYSAKGDELAKQAETAAESGLSGSIFTGLANIAEINVKDTAPPPEKAPSSELKTEKLAVSKAETDAEPANISVKLNVTKPEKTSYTTYEQVVTFSGTADPSLPLTINGKTADVDQSGNFSATKNLDMGENVFVISQNGTEAKYNITRQVSLIKEISPTGVIMAEGNMSITITAVAYAQADIYAYINGTKVPMSVDPSAKLANGDSGFELFSGEYVAPDANGDEVLVLGGITVYGEYDGQNEVVEGAYLKVNKVAGAPANGIPIAITADQAKTYPAKTANNIPDSTFYPLPKGTRDYAVGDEVVYKKNKNEIFTYRVLASGMRVESKDLKEVAIGPSYNKISKLSVDEPGDGFTYIRLTTEQKVSFRFSYKTDRVEILFNNTSETPNSTSLKANEMFSKASWSDDNVLTLKLNKAGSFMGYKAYYEDGELVFRFNIPPNSIKGARIAIDPGHGGKDPGTLGYRADMPESVIARRIAEKLEAELKERGATVKLLETANVSLSDRVLMGENVKADVFVSIHGNSSANTAATGTEVYYFNAFSRVFAQSAAGNVAKQLDTINRGARPSYYHVTLSSQMASILVETGFLSNKAEYQKLITEKYQNRVATGIADSIEAAIKSVRTGSTTLVSTNTAADDDDDDYDDYDYEDDDDDDDEDDDDDDDEDDDNEYDEYDEYDLIEKDGILLKNAENPYVNTEYLEIFKGNYERVEIMSETDDVIKNSEFKWKSDNTSVASVDSRGVVRAKNVGKATIIATSRDLELYCDVEVTNTKVALKSLALEKTETTISKGRTERLKLTFKPSNTTDRNITWSSSNNIVATVSDEGVVRGINPGTATITARNKTTGLTSKCVVEVVRGGINIEEIEMRYDYLDMGVGDKDDLPVVLYPSSVTETKVVWSSSNPEVVKVDSKGNITALKRGKATIRATSAASKRIYAECEIQVYE